MLLKTAPEVWSALRGIICVHKPAEISVANVRHKIITKICEDLNKMETRPPIEHVSIKVNELGNFDVNVQQNLADHPMVVGPRYIGQDLPCSWSNFLGTNTSGVLIFGLRSGTKWAKFIRENQPTRAYKIKGTFGQATDTFYKDGRIVEKSTFRHIKQVHLEQLLAQMQASHQKKMFELCGVDIQSQTAYELACKGLIRPANNSVPVIYRIKCVDFEPPNFTIEIQCANEYEKYLMGLIHEMGTKLHSTAHCTGIKCIRHSYFTIEDALLKRQWSLQEFLLNMERCTEILDQHENILEQTSAALTY